MGGPAHVLGRVGQVGRVGLVGSDSLMDHGGNVDDRREIFGWMMYDWANSAFQTTVLTVLAGPYLTALAQQAAGENGTVLRLWPVGSVTAKSLFPYCISLSVFLQVFLLPLVGALADYTNLKKPLMAIFCYLGTATTCLFLIVTQGRHLLGGALLVVANLSFGITIVLYNAFLNDVASGARRDEVSSRGYALGYLGGGLLLAVNLALVSTADGLGLSKGLAVRLSLASAGAWWGGFSVLTFARLRSRAPRKTRPQGISRGPGLLSLGVAELRASFRELARLPHTLQFLVGYMAYNDGIQTVISIASVFLAQELFVSRGLPANESFLIGLILMVQFVAFFGSLAFERVAGIVDTRNAILLSLVIWTAVIIYAYGFLQTVAQAWMMGGAIALVLGGSQALSRSLFSRMIPAGREAAFFGLYEISERGTSWIGPLIFGIVVSLTNSYRQAILSLIVLFLTGMTVLLFTDTDRAILEASRPAPEAGPGG
jgi:MFS transporter, UMF1 family